MGKVLQTRRIGLRPHFSGHPLAPMEIVYEVEEPVRPARRWRVPLHLHLITYASCGMVTFGLVRLVIFLITGDDIAR